MRKMPLITAAAGFYGFLFACRATREHGVVIARSGKPTARVVVTMVGSATKESGPAKTIKNFGEVYAFLPDVFAVRRDQPTRCRARSSSTAP